MPHLVRKEICGIFEAKNLTKEQKRKYIKTEREISKIPTDDSKFKYARNDVIEKMIKSCRGVKTCNNGINRIEKKKDKEKILESF